MQQSDDTAAVGNDDNNNESPDLLILIPSPPADNTSNNNNAQELIKKKRTKKKQENPKQVWLLSFGSSADDITYEMLTQCGLKDKVQEIHIALWRETKYVLLRFGREGRMRMHQMKGVVKQLHDKFQVVSNEILGYEAITGNTKKDGDDEGIKEHPGFKYIVDEIKLKKGTVRSWMMMKKQKQQLGDGEEEEAAAAAQEEPTTQTKKRGRCFLQRVVGKDDLERMPRRVLIEKMLAMEAKLVEADAMKETFDALSDQLLRVETENMMLRIVTGGGGGRNAASVAATTTTTTTTGRIVGEQSS